MGACRWQGEEVVRTGKAGKKGSIVTTSTFSLKIFTSSTICFLCCIILGWQYDAKSWDLLLTLIQQVIKRIPEAPPPHFPSLIWVGVQIRLLQDKNLFPESCQLSAWLTNHLPAWLPRGQRQSSSRKRKAKKCICNI